MKQFPMKFSYGKGMEKPFSVVIVYDTIKDMPVGMQFVNFENKDHFEKAKICLHNCVQNKQIRYFIKNVPDSVKPFSLKISTCPNCGVPITYKFIIYPGDLKMYPKMRDIKKYKNKGIIQINQELPKAVETNEFRIGVN